MLLSPASAATAHQTQSGEHYYYQRWLWCNWPFIALRVASNQDAAATEPTSPAVSAMENGGEENDSTLESTVREETRTASLPASLQTKLDKIHLHLMTPQRSKRQTRQLPSHFQLVDSLKKFLEQAGWLHQNKRYVTPKDCWMLSE